MTITNPRNPYRIARRAGYQGARSAAVPTSAQRSENQLRGQQAKFLTCKKPTLISTFNDHTLNPINQMPELVLSAIERNINVICIQKHRYFHSDVELKHHDVGKGWNFISVSAWKNSIGATISGVGMLLIPLAHKALTSMEEVEPRVLIASFNANPKTTIISRYSPTNSSDEDGLTHFYVCLFSCQTSPKP